MTDHLTRKQRGVFDAATAITRRQGHGPSVRDIARELGVTAATVQGHLVELERKGFVRRSGTAFGLELIEQGRRRGAASADDVVEVPVVGQIAAGRPLEAIEDSSDRIPLPRSMLRGESFVLRVRGESMRDDAILDGDLVVVTRRSTAENGEIVVALLEDGTATLKRIYREDGGIPAATGERGNGADFRGECRGSGRRDRGDPALRGGSYLKPTCVFASLRDLGVFARKRSRVEFHAKTPRSRKDAESTLPS